MKLGEVLRIFRIINDKSVKEVANELGCSITHVSDVEHNRKNAGLDRIKKFAGVYKVNASQVFSIQESSALNNWNFQKTMYEALLEWFKSNPEH